MTQPLAFHYRAADIPLAVIPAGFVYRGVFYGRALDPSMRWHRLEIPLSEFCALLGDPA
jgi:hypothetical protein